LAFCQIIKVAAAAAFIIKIIIMDDEEEEAKPKYIMQILQSQYKDDVCADFQSITAADITCKDPHKKLFTFVQNIFYTAFELHGYDDGDNDSSGSSSECDWETHIMKSLGKMIGNEMIVSKDGGHYYIFYRVVSENLILYEFNTLMLRMFAENEEYWASGSSSSSSEPTAIICTPCILEDEYKLDIEGMFEEIKNEGMPFSEFCNNLLSVNNCLLPENSITDFHFWRKHYPEAPPCRFSRGFFIGPQWMYEIQEFVARFFGLSETEAKALTSAIENIYRQNQHIFDADTTTTTTTTKTSSGPKAGHLLQICIPCEVADHFVFNAIEYSHPVSVYVLENGKHVAYTPLRPPPPNAVRKLSLHEIMHSPDMANMQSRILAHPNLFLCHGAFTNVVSGNPLFDRQKFQQDLLLLLHPLICAAKAQSKSLHFNKFSSLYFHTL